MCTTNYAYTLTNSNSNKLKLVDKSISYGYKSLSLGYRFIDTFKLIQCILLVTDLEILKCYINQSQSLSLYCIQNIQLATRILNIKNNRWLYNVEWTESIHSVDKIEFNVVALFLSTDYKYMYLSKNKQSGLIARFSIADDDVEGVITSLERILRDSDDVSRMACKSKFDKQMWWERKNALDVELRELIERMQGWFSWFIYLLLDYSVVDIPGFTRCFTDFNTLIDGSFKEPLFAAMCLGYSKHHLSAILDYIYVCFSTRHNPKTLKNKVVDILSQGQLCVVAIKSNLTLVLDKRLLRLPFESMPFLHRVPVYRIPSFDFIHLALERRSTLIHSVHLPYTTYLLDPTGDLPSTHATFSPLLSLYRGLSHPPTPSEFASLLTDSSLFVFLGHGSTDQYITPSTLLSLQPPPALLIGCSSCHLPLRGDCEPTNIVYAYLQAGSHCVVGNLWDVTDKDVDRLVVKMWQEWGKGGCLGSAVSRGREGCVMRWLVGGSMVVWGLPVVIGK